VSSELTTALPHDDYAEKAILGAMLIDNRYASEVFAKITAEDFYKESHKRIAQAIKEITDSGSIADTITVASYFERIDKLKFIGGYAYLNSLPDGIPDNFSLDEYIKIVTDRSVLRRIILLSMGTIKKGIELKADTNDLLSDLHHQIIKISEAKDKDGFHPATELVLETMQLVERIQKKGDSGGIKTDFYGLDNLTSGFQKGDLIVIAARPSMGKTAFALNLAANMAVKFSKAVGFFSIEMSRSQIMMRLLSAEASINMTSLMSGKPRLNQQEWHDLEQAANRLQQAQFFIDDSPSLSVIEMKSRARRLKTEAELDVVFVDYLQLLKVSGTEIRKNDSRAQEVAIISASLKELAKELQIPVVALAQLNRAPEQRGGKREPGPRYQLSDLKESGAIEQDADLIMFLHREDQVNKETERKGEADLIIAKQRNGPTGKITLAFSDKFTRFHNLEFTDREYF
jgi:replicative DNA helicase